MSLELLFFYRDTSKDEPPRVLSEEEMNRLGARIVKAELMGNMVMFLKNCHALLEFFFEAPTTATKVFIQAIEKFCEL